MQASLSFTAICILLFLFYFCFFLPGVFVCVWMHPEFQHKRTGCDVTLGYLVCVYFTTARTFKLSLILLQHPRKACLLSTHCFKGLFFIIKAMEVPTNGTAEQVSEIWPSRVPFPFPPTSSPFCLIAHTCILLSWGLMGWTDRQMVIVLLTFSEMGIETVALFKVHLKNEKELVESYSFGKQYCTILILILPWLWPKENLKVLLCC